MEGRYDEPASVVAVGRGLEITVHLGEPRCRSTGGPTGPVERPQRLFRSTKIRDAENDKQDFEMEQAGANFLAQFNEGKWKSWDVRQKRIAIDAVLSYVIVLPIPEGRSTRAPFDPTLLVPVWRKSLDKDARPEQSTDNVELLV